MSAATAPHSFVRIGAIAACSVRSVRSSARQFRRSTPAVADRSAVAGVWRRPRSCGRFLRAGMAGVDRLPALHYTSVTAPAASSPDVETTRSTDSVRPKAVAANASQSHAQHFARRDAGCLVGRPRGQRPEGLGTSAAGRALGRERGGGDPRTLGTACRSRAPKRRPLACLHHRQVLQLCEFDREQDARAARPRIVTEEVRLHDRVECGDTQFPSQQRQ